MLPRTMYVLNWFPRRTQTFIFREVVDLRRLGLPLSVFTLRSAVKHDHLSEEMRAFDGEVTRLGWRGLPRILGGVGYWAWRRPGLTSKLFATIPWRPGESFAKHPENFWGLLCAFALARHCKDERVEHIHACWAVGPATAAWVASRLTGIPFSFTGRAWDIYPPDGWIREKILAATFVRSNTAAGICQLTRYAGGAADRLRLTYNGLPLGATGDAAVAMRQPYQLLAIGRFVPQKGFKYLLRALRILADEGTDVRLTLLGDGPLLWPLRFRAYRLNIAGHVTFPGFQSHHLVADYFRASDIFVMPSVVTRGGNRDGIPNVVMEALAHRLPVIATNVSGIPELIEDGVTGLLVPEKDPTALAAAIRRLIADRTAALAMAERGRARVLDQFDPERNHRRLLDMYSALKAT
jgi:glycosyltransferase involved in cell wall biosynthesis